MGFQLQPGVLQKPQLPSEVSLLLAVLLVVTLSISLVGLVVVIRWLCIKKRVAPSSLLTKPSSSVDSGRGLQSGRHQQHDLSSNQISLSTPDFLEQDAMTAELRRGKTVVKQQTMPVMTQRHLLFHRQLSHRLDQSESSLLAGYGCPTISSYDSCSSASPSTTSPATSSTPVKERRNGGEMKPESVGGGGGSTAQKNGRLYLSVSHDDVSLAVHVHRAENLPPKDFSGTSDPYVKVSLLPDRRAKRHTRVHRRTLNPVFDEQFTFLVERTSEQGGAARENAVLQLAVYDFDRFSRHDLIGVCFVRDLFSKAFKDIERHYVLDIISVQQSGDDLGELMLSVRYLPTAGRLTLTILKARNLRRTDDRGTCVSTFGSYVKVILMCRGRQIKKRKTSVRKGTISPVINDSMVFDVPQDSIEEVCLVIKVIELDSTGRSDVLGVCGIGPQFTGTGREHWLDMLENPRKSIAQWYKLDDHLTSSSAPTTSTAVSQDDRTSNRTEPSDHLLNDDDEPLLSNGKHDDFSEEG